MRVACPTCNAIYEVPATVVQAGRTLRCASCGSQFPASEAPPAAAPPPAPPPAAPMQAAAPTPSVTPIVDTLSLRIGEAARLAPVPGGPAASAARPRASAAVLASWALSLILLGTGAVAAVAWRQQIMAAWPPSARAYAVLGYRR